MSSNHSSPSHRRFDPFFGDWVIFSPIREERPDDYKKNKHFECNSEACPFCVGHESQTPPSLWVGKASNGTLSTIQREHSGQVLCNEDWKVRVFRNRFPAIPTTQQSIHDKSQISAVSPTEIVGGHEVIVDTPIHTDRVSETSINESRLLLRAIRDRIAWWNQGKNIRHVTVFKNCGASAGASLHHSHCQLIASDHYPKQVQGLLNRSRLFTKKYGQCLLCNETYAELEDNSRTIFRGKSIAAYCPYASRFPMQVRIAPLDHQAQIEESSSDTLDETAMVVRRSVLALQQLFPNIAYNLVFSNLPPRKKKYALSFHWSVDLCPRSSSIAGFEIATGNMINCVLPEKAAQMYLRQLNLNLID